MLTDPVALIDQTIANLETLAALFADEFDERIHDSETTVGALCRHAHRRIDELLPTLRAARQSQSAQEARQSGIDRQRPCCVDCD